MISGRAYTHSRRHCARAVYATLYTHMRAHAHFTEQRSANTLHHTLTYVALLIFLVENQVLTLVGALGLLRLVLVVQLLDIVAANVLPALLLHVVHCVRTRAQRGRGRGGGLLSDGDCIE